MYVAQLTPLSLVKQSSWVGTMRTAAPGAYRAVARLFGRKKPSIKPPHINRPLPPPTGVGSRATATQAASTMAPFTTATGRTLPPPSVARNARVAPNTTTTAHPYGTGKPIPTVPRMGNFDPNAAVAAAKGTAGAASGAAGAATAGATTAGAAASTAPITYRSIRQLMNTGRDLDRSIARLQPKWFAGLRSTEAGKALLPQLQAQRASIQAALDHAAKAAPTRTALAQGVDKLKGLGRFATGGTLFGLGAGTGLGTGYATGADAGATQAAQVMADKIDQMSAGDAFKMWMGKLWDPQIVSNSIIPGMANRPFDEFRQDYPAGMAGMTQALGAHRVLNQLNREFQIRRGEVPSENKTWLESLLGGLRTIGSLSPLGGMIDPNREAQEAMVRAFGTTDAQKLLERQQQTFDLLRQLQTQYS